MVFESIVVSVLNSTLGQWVEGLDADALKISVFKGEVVLRNLELKESAFDGLGVPVSLVAGHVGLIKLDIPWRSLASKPIRIEIDSVFAAIKPQPQFESRDEHGLKRARLSADEMRFATAGEGDADGADAKSQSLLVQKIIEAHLNSH